MLPFCKGGDFGALLMRYNYIVDYWTFPIFLLCSRCFSLPFHRLRFFVKEGDRMEKEYSFCDLTEKQQKLMRLLLPQVFIEDETVKPKTKTDAYREAYPNSNIANAAAEVDRMINNKDGKFPKFSQVYARAREEVRARAEKEYEETIMSGAEALSIVSEIARGNEEDTELIGVGQGEQELISVPVKMHDRLKALDLMARILGLVNNKVSVEGTLPVTIIDDLGGKKDGNMA